MKVDIVNSNTKLRGNPYNTGVTKLKNTPHFTGMDKTEKEIMDFLFHKKTIEFMKSFEWLKGEIGGILLTALGTGAVAPIFIGFNPFVHAPKDATPEEKEDVINTKQYTAMRQPVSAALAILFQAGVQKYIDKGLDAVFNNPKHSEKARINLDQQVLNTDTYIKGLVKKEMAEENEIKPSLIKSWFSSDVRKARKEYKEKFNAKVDAKKEDQLNKVIESLKKDHIIHIGHRDLEHKTTAELINKQIDNYIEDAKELRKNSDQRVFYKKRAQTLIENEDYLKEIFKEVPTKKVKDKMVEYVKIMNAVPVDETKKTNCEKELKELYKEVGDSVQKLLEKEKDSKIQTILGEIMSKPEELRANRIERTLQRIKVIKEMSKPYKNKDGKPLAQITFFKNNTADADLLKEILKDCPLEKDIAQMDSKEIAHLYSKAEANIKALAEKETDAVKKAHLQEFMKELKRAKILDDTGFTADNYGKALRERNNILSDCIEKLKEAKIKEPYKADASIIEKTIKKVISVCSFDVKDAKLKPILENTNTFDHNLEKLSNKIYKDVAKAYKKLVENNYKSWNQITKIGVGVFITLPITCTALNWVYPRFMEIFFPKLAGVKKAQTAEQAGQQGGNK